MGPLTVSMYFFKSMRRNSNTRYKFDPKISTNITKRQYPGNNLLLLRRAYGILGFLGFFGIFKDFLEFLRIF